jgi:hypothetical protein
MRAPIITISISTKRSISCLISERDTTPARAFWKRRSLERVDGISVRKVEDIEIGRNSKVQKECSLGIDTDILVTVISAIHKYLTLLWTCCRYSAPLNLFRGSACSLLSMFAEPNPMLGTLRMIVAYLDISFCRSLSARKDCNCQDMSHYFLAKPMFLACPIVFAHFVVGRKKLDLTQTVRRIVAVLHEPQIRPRTWIASSLNRINREQVYTELPER